MQNTAPTIPAEVANHVLAHFGAGGYQAGSFTTHLLCAFATADEANFNQLAFAFPEYASAVAAIQYDPHGVTRLQTIARGEEADEASAVPQCPEALFNPETDDLRRCVQQGPHEWHKTLGGSEWRVRVEESTEVPF